MGCGGTSKVLKKKTTAFGFGAGPANTGRENTFIGYKAGHQNKDGHKNVYIGYEAGKTSHTAVQNVFVGNRTGFNNSGVMNTFLGHEAGFNNSADFNVFLGRHAGFKNTTGQSNIFIGTGAGYSNETGDSNVFIAGGIRNTTGEENTFLGYGAGNSNKIGNNNVFIGHAAGLVNTTGKHNVFIGDRVGPHNTTGKYNIFIGSSAGHGFSSNDNQFIVGNTNSTGWIKADIGTTTFRINHKQVCYENPSYGSPCFPTHTHPYAPSGHGHSRLHNHPAAPPGGGPGHSPGASSRTLKKNIKPFKDVNKSLKDLVETPLFTYYYKNKHDNPEKKRMGIISEELPEYLQIKEKGKPSRPDWVSIYGSFWAGIKALYETLRSFKKEIVLKVEILKTHLEELKHELTGQQKKIKKDLLQVKTGLSTTKKELANLLTTEKKLQDQLTETRTKLNQTSNKLLVAEKEIKKMRKKLNELINRLSTNKRVDHKENL